MRCRVSEQVRVRPPWVDRWREEGPARPWRKVHLDYHNSHHVPRLGWAFDPDDFGERLLGAGVNAIVVFAKDMHGYCYYPSALGPVHPGLSFDLLGAQVAACRARGIAVLPRSIYAAGLNPASRHTSAAA